MTRAEQVRVIGNEAGEVPSDKYKVINEWINEKLNA